MKDTLGAMLSPQGAVSVIRRPLLKSEKWRTRLTVLEQMRKRYQFVVAGYVVMPEHIHLIQTMLRRSNSII